MQAAAPARSHHEHVDLVLDSGACFQVHCCSLIMHSDLLRDVLRTLAAPAAGSIAKLHLSGVTTEQILLLRDMLYHSEPAAWAMGRSFSQLVQLASVCHAVACYELLGIVEETLMHQIATSFDLQAGHHLELYAQATRCGMRRLQQSCIPHLVQLAPQLTAAEAGHAHDLLLPVLGEAHILAQALSEISQTAAARQKQLSTLLKHVSKQLEAARVLSEYTGTDYDFPDYMDRAQALVEEAQSLAADEE